jgi:nucleotide-binding universal stress UspA family protein
VSYPTVIVGTDGSTTATRAAQVAAAFAEVIGAELLVAAAYERTRPQDLGPPSDRAGGGEAVLSSGYRAAAETAQDTAAVALRGRRVRSDTAAVEGDPAEALLDLAGTRPGSLLVVGNRGMSDSTRFLLGNVPNKVSHHATGDVLIVRTDTGREGAAPRRVVVGTDGSRTALRAVERAARLVADLGPDASLTIASVGDADGARAAIEEGGTVAGEHGVAWTGAARDGDPASGLLEIAADHDLLVVGNRGMTGAARFLLGSVPNKVSHHTPTDLLIVQTDDRART